jgi:hypothetical protein
MNSATTSRTWSELEAIRRFDGREQHREKHHEMNTRREGGVPPAKALASPSFSGSVSKPMLVNKRASRPAAHFAR